MRSSLLLDLFFEILAEDERMGRQGVDVHAGIRDKVLPLEGEIAENEVEMGRV